jgi:hypothetical protein
MNFWMKTLITAVIIASANGLMRWSPKASAALVALPLSSLIYLTWLWNDSRDNVTIATASMDIFRIVIPSLLFFPVLSWGITKWGWSFPVAMTVASLAAIGAYVVQRSLGWG